MEVEMKDEEKRPDKDLPPIPDYPEAPLPAWKHYGITNFADQKVQEELDRLQYPGHMVGLEVAYELEDEKTYAMAFGKIDIPEDELQESAREIPLTDEFLANLYKVVDDLIPHHSPGHSENMNTEITIVMSGSLKKVKVKCRKPEQCSQGHTDKRWCKKVGKEPWTCLDGHQKCS
jgi:hypothetical protein